MSQNAVSINPKIILERFNNLKVWTKGYQRAPHKPLLVLLALGEASRGKPREIPYAHIDKTLKQLLIDFGPPRKSYHPEYPFWRLQADGVWEVHSDHKLKLRKNQTDVPKSELIRHNATGGFKIPVFRALKDDPKLIKDVAEAILNGHFPETIHDDIRSAVGLDLAVVIAPKKSKRDPQFRQNVLRAYEYRCAVCGFDVRIDNRTIGLEAAHIKWHQAGGPDVENNGLALCTLHHKIFDMGAFTISGDDLKVNVSERVHGSGSGFSDWLLQFHGRELFPTVNPKYSAGPMFVKWHNREVFKGPGRPIR